MKKKRIYIAGQEGMVGQSIYKLLKIKKYHIIDCKRKDLNFVYKLHPNEFSYVEEYVSYFIENTNVKIITDQVDTSTLISQSSLVVLIVSTVVYEALNQQKKVAIYKKINFERQLHLLECPNVYFFNNEDDAFGILDQEVISNESNYYKETDLLSIKRIFE